MDADEIVAILNREASAENVAGMARFGIASPRAYGLSVARLRQIARDAVGRGRSRDLAKALWKEGSHEAKILVSLLDDPATLTVAQAERYLTGCDNWAVTDAFAMNLFDRAPWAYAKAADWASREDKFGKRAAFALMAALAVHDKKADDDAFRAFLPLCEREAGDGRNHVKKGVSWALRQMGKRSPALRREAMAAAGRIAKQGTPSARWIASDVRRELEKPARKQSR